MHMPAETHEEHDEAYNAYMKDAPEADRRQEKDCRAIEAAEGAAIQVTDCQTCKEFDAQQTENIKAQGFIDAWGPCLRVLNSVPRSDAL